MPVEAPSWLERWREGKQGRRENWRDWEVGPGRDVSDYLQGLDLGGGQIFDRQIGSGRLSVNLPTEYGDPKVGSIADYLSDPQGWGDAAEQDQWDRALRATYTIPFGGGGAAGGRVGRRPRYMNEGGIASLMSNGGLEAMMLDLEGDAAALPGDLFSGEYDPRWLSHPEDEGYVDDAKIRRQLQRKGGAQIGEWWEDLTDMFDMQEAYDEELEVLDSANPQDSDSLSMRELGEMLVPGGGGMKMGMAVTKVGERALREIKKMLAKTKRPPPTIIEREIKGGGYRDVTKEPPPKLWYGGAPLYKKGYYGKSYK